MQGGGSSVQQAATEGYNSANAVSAYEQGLLSNAHAAPNSPRGLTYSFRLQMPSLSATALSATAVSENPKFNSILNPNQRLPVAQRSSERERLAVSDRDVTHSDLVEIAKRNGDLRKNYVVLVGAFLICAR